MEAAALGTFMVSASVFGWLTARAPAGPVGQRALMGLAMGLTAIGIIYSPWGRQSGAHMNPAVTLTFYSLGKIDRPDAVFYVLFQFLGGVAGVILAAALLGPRIADPAVNYVVTLPGPGGVWIAFAAELGISFLLMLVILAISNHPRLASWTGLSAGILVAAYITVEAPLSGMSMNPARTFGSALPAGIFDALWIYFTAPPLGMLLASKVYAALKGRGRVLCAKLQHAGGRRCIFRCGYMNAGP
jgi:aquaporin Z